MSSNLAPAWDILINGTTLVPDGIKALIGTVTVEASVDGADELTIQAQAYNPTGTPGERWALVDAGLLSPGNYATIYMGYLDGDDLLTCLQRFRLVSEDVAYPAGGVPTVTIRGYSAEARLAENTEPRAWEGPIADSAIVEEIAQDHGIEVDLEATPDRDAGRIKPRGESDLVFVRKLAVANGYGPPVVRYDDDADVDVLTFKAQAVDTSEAFTFTYDPTEAEADRPQGNLLSFRAQLDLHGVPTTVVVGGWDPDLQAPVVVTMEVGSSGQDPVILVGWDGPGAANTYGLHGASEFQAKALEDSDDPRDKLIESMSLPETVVDVEGAVEWATRWIKLRAAAFLAGSATTLGHPKVWIGQVHNFDGLAAKHVGLWEVLTARHSMSAGGYTLSLDLARILEEATEPEEG